MAGKAGVSLTMVDRVVIGAAVVILGGGNLSGQRSVVDQLEQLRAAVDRAAHELVAVRADAAEQRKELDRFKGEVNGRLLALEATLRSGQTRRP